MTKEKLQKEIFELEATVARYQTALQQRVDELSQIESHEFIDVHGVTMDKIQSSRIGKMFGTITGYCDWLRFNSDKPFAEWNGRVYVTAELDEWPHIKSCRLEDVKE